MVSGVSPRKNSGGAGVAGVAAGDRKALEQVVQRVTAALLLGLLVQAAGLGR